MLFDPRALRYAPTDSRHRQSDYCDTLWLYGENIRLEIPHAGAKAHNFGGPKMTTPIRPIEPDSEELEYSAHCGMHSQDGVEVEVSIYRPVGTDAWELEVVNQNGGSTIWEDTFPTDNAAYTEFLATLAKDGIGLFDFDDPTEH